MREKCPTRCLLFSSPPFAAHNEFKGRVHVVFDVFVFMLVLIVHSLLVCNFFLNIGVAKFVVIIVALLSVVVLCSLCYVFISHVLFSLSGLCSPRVAKPRVAHSRVNIKSKNTVWRIRAET